jgi:hypothetical protein
MIEIQSADIVAKIHYHRWMERGCARNSDYLDAQNHKIQAAEWSAVLSKLEEEEKK